MEMYNEFELPLSVDEAWVVLTDIERIAPCLPGAQLDDEVGDTSFSGAVKVKVGPINMQYRGNAEWVEKDPSARLAVLVASGRDTRGQGKARATITASMTPVGTGTRVSVSTELEVTGKVAQFGRGVLNDVSAKLLEQFVLNLQATGVTGPEDETLATGARTIQAEGNTQRGAGGGMSDPVESIDLLGLVSGTVVKTVGAVSLVVVALFWLRLAAKRRRR